MKKLFRNRRPVPVRVPTNDELQALIDAEVEQLATGCTDFDLMKHMIAINEVTA